MDSVFGQSEAGPYFLSMDNHYLLHLYQPSNSRYDLLRHAQIHCKISIFTFVLVLLFNV